MASKNRLTQAAGASIGGFFSKTDDIKPEHEQITQDVSQATVTIEPPKQKTAYQSMLERDAKQAKVVARVSEETENPTRNNLARQSQNPTEAPEPSQPIQSIPAEEKAENKTNTKPLKQSFSFRADIDKIEAWKLYADSIGAKDLGALWTAAIDEYISNHALTARQQEIYDMKKKTAEMQKNQQ